MSTRCRNKLLMHLMQFPSRPSSGRSTLIDLALDGQKEQRSNGVSERNLRNTDSNFAHAWLAGFSDRQLVLKGTLGTIDQQMQAMDENWMGLVVIGDAAR
jgi:hypothetical protein